MKVLYLDCFSGAAGDMILGALIDAGVPIEDVRTALGSLGIGAGAADLVWTEKVNRAGITATKFSVRGEEDPDHARSHAHAHEHGHSHSHDQPHSHDHGPGSGHAHGHSHDAGGRHAHRSLADIRHLIDHSALGAAGKARAKALFDRLGDAEAAVHGTPADTVHLHEVGALDSIIDIVGSVFAFEALGADRIVASPLNVGSGRIRSSHGLYPVPAPATVRLLEGVPIYAGHEQAELVTPTGALLVTSYASEFGVLPPMRVARVGYGAGSRDFSDTPNVVRVLVGEADAAAGQQQVVVIEAEIDDMNPQIYGVVMDQLLALGALDVFYTAIQMKKNRPGTLLSVVAPPDAREVLMSAIFRETTTIGVRYRAMARECLDREMVTVTTAAGPVRVKVARRDGRIVNASPEFDDCLRLATAHGRPVKDIQALATKAFVDLSA